MHQTIEPIAPTRTRTCTCRRCGKQGELRENRGQETPPRGWTEERIYNGLVAGELTHVTFVCRECADDAPARRNHANRQN